MSRKLFTRREGLLTLGAATFAARAAHTEPGKMIVHRSATCGCCGAWGTRMRAAGFTVEEIVEPDMDAVKARLRVPRDMHSCHTAEIDGYLVEGHVPARAIREVLSQRPQAMGVAAPGMPIVAPGMESGPPEIYRLYLFDSTDSRAFGEWRGDSPV
jgi:hypothetical protein